MSKSSQIALLYNEQVIIYDGSHFKSADFKDTKTNFTSALIPVKYLNAFSYKIAKDTSDDEIAMQTEIKMYNEGGLNSDKEYVIDYIKYDIESEYLIEAFALSKDNFDVCFGDYAKKVAAIDMLSPRFLTYQALYDEENVGKNDLILYISESESFATLYQKGRYIGYRNLNSIEEMSKRLGIEVAKLKEYLKTKGLIQENYGLDEMHILDAIQGILLKDIEKIMYSLNQKRSLFGFDGIDRVFVDFEGSNISGLDQFFISYGYDSLSIEALKYDDEKYGSISIAAKYLYSLNSTDEEEDKHFQSLNLSFLQRKKPISQYLTFKYILAFVITLGICFAVYAYLETVLSQQRSVIEQKQMTLKQEKSKTAKLRTKFIEFKKKYKDLQKTQKKIEDEVFIYKETLATIPLMQSEKYKRQKFINDVVLALKKYRLSVLYIKQYDNKTMDIMLVSDNKKRDSIAKFMKELLQKGYKSATTKQIYLENNIYKSQIRIEK